MKRSILLIGIVIMSSWAPEILCHDAWTWLYQKKFTSQELKESQNKHNVIFCKESVPQFSQLMFSWNAFRPSAGHFTFYVQVRDAKNKSWGTWHKMAEWGAHVQRSFSSKVAGATKFLYVRLEGQKGRLSDAFRVRVHADQGADLAKVRSLAVSLSNFNQFKESRFDSTLSSLSSTYIQDVPKQSQFKVPYIHNDSICSPTSVGMLVGSLTREDVNYRDIVRGSFDHGLGVHGSWPFNMAYAFEKCKGNVHFSVSRLNSFAQLHERLQKGIPVVVSVRGYLEGAPKQYDKGHLMVVVGWDAKRQQVICHDPAFKSNNGVLKRYAARSFLDAWDRSYRLAYLADPIRMT